MLKKSTLAVALLAASFGASVMAATPDEKADKAQYKADVAKAKADYKAAKKACDPLRGKDETACNKQAKADLVKAEADAKHAHP